MRNFAKRFDSPSMIVAVIALVVAIGGTAIAAGKLSGSSLKNQSVAGKKLKNNTVTGKQVNEATLAPVPKARTIASDVRYSAQLSFGQTKTLGGLGPLTLTATCLENTTDDNGNPNRDVARVLISTTQSLSVFEGSQDSKTGGPLPADFLNPNTPATDRVAFENSVPTGAPDWEGDSELSAAAPNNSASIFIPDRGNGVGNNILNADCTFRGVATRVLAG